MVNEPMKVIAVVGLALMIALCPVASSETLYYVDGQGNIISFDSDDPSHPFRLPSGPPTKTILKTGIQFNVTLMDRVNSTAMGFDDPATGVDASAVLDRVFSYLDSVLEETGVVDILFRTSLNDPGSALLAAAGPIFDETPGFRNGAAFDHITTGIDPNGNDIPDIIAQVNFGNPWYTGTDEPPEDEFDLFTALVHELTHGLGLVSLSGETGVTSMPEIYSVWDGLLQRSLGADLFALIKGVPAFVGIVADLVSEDVVFTGFSASALHGQSPAVFAPPFFASGSSLAHFDPSVGETTVMRPAIDRGVATREYAIVELGVLQDLGYSVNNKSNVFCPPESIDAKSGDTLMTELSGVPWTPKKGRRAEKVIYGDDDRIDVFEETDETRLVQAASTCGLVLNSSLTENEDETFTLATFDYMPFVQGVGSFPPCEEEPFATQPTATICSGFLAGSNIIVTAGHCFDEIPFGFFSYVFGFEMTDAETPRTILDANQVYRGVEVISKFFVQGEPLDYAVIRLDRDVTAPGALPQPMRLTSLAPIGTPLGVIGHPAGLPIKLAFGDATALAANCDDEFFIANLDTFAGNSGSPVFNADTNLVEGILVYGRQDFVLDGECAVSNRLLDSDVAPGLGEQVTKTTAFAKYVPDQEGNLFLDKTLYECVDVMSIRLSDSDLAEFTEIEVTITTDNSVDLEILTLIQTMPGSSEFTGSIDLTGGFGDVNNGTLEVIDGSTVTITYEDEDIGSKVAGIIEASVQTTCPPVIMCAATAQAGLATRPTWANQGADLLLLLILAIGLTMARKTHRPPAH